MVYVVADPGRGRLVVANAGHPPPILIEPSGAARQLEIGHGRLLGLRPSLPRREHVVGRELRRAVAQVAVVVDDQRSAEGVTQISSGRSSVAVHRWLIEPRSNVASHDGIAELPNCRGLHGQKLAVPAKTSLRGRGSRAAWRSPRARPPSSP
jgi:hypothetical protein